jgi:hypothetical protein
LCRIFKGDTFTNKITFFELKGKAPSSKEIMLSKSMSLVVFLAFVLVAFDSLMLDITSLWAILNINKSKFKQPLQFRNHTTNKDEKP